MKPGPLAAAGNPAGQSRRLLTVKEAAAILGTSTATIRRQVAAGRLPVVKISRRLQFDPSDLERLIQQVKDRSGW